LTVDEATGFEIVEIDELKSDFAAEPDPDLVLDLPFSQPAAGVQATGSTR
jgi:hypothetical protein